MIDPRSISSGYQPRNFQDQVDAIMLRLGGASAQDQVPDDGIGQAYAPAPPPRNFTIRDGHVVGEGVVEEIMCLDKKPPRKSE